jgi:tetratricopeptide (TPR) repeat protein
MYYCARELFFVGQFEQASKYFRNHLELPRAVWAPERAFSMRFLAKIHEAEREMWLLRACAEYPAGREVWVDLAQHYYNVGNWQGCFYAATQALNIKTKPLLYLNEETAWGWLPHDLLAIAAHRLSKNDIAIVEGQKAIDLSPNDERLKTNMFFYRNVNNKVNVVIPFKSHIVGLLGLIADLMLDDKVNKIVVIADGEQAFNMITKLDIQGDIVRAMVPEGAGISTMWNLGIEICGDEHAIAFINDDVRLDLNCISTLLTSLDKNSNIGLICPNYTKIEMTDNVSVTTTCRGKYDGTGGLAGFCFVLAKDLVKEYKFDTSLTWYWGDDDIVNWVTKTKKRLAIISNLTKCKHEHSKTITSNPPKDFNNIIQKDKEYFERKWSNNAR